MKYFFQILLTVLLLIIAPTTSVAFSVGDIQKLVKEDGNALAATWYVLGVVEAFSIEANYGPEYPDCVLNYAREGDLIEQMMESKLPEFNAAFFVWMQVSKACDHLKKISPNPCKEAEE